MKSKIFAFIMLLSATLSLSSCLNSDDTTVEYTHDTAITAFSLGKLDRWSKTSAGKDTLLKSNIDGSNYKFYIDQTLRKIYNVDSLPCGVRDTAVLATISAKESSPVLLMDIDKTDSVAAYYSSSDSINFSKPRYIRVYSNDLSAYVTYEVTVNIHKEQADVFNWKTLATNNAGLKALSDLKLLALDDNVFVFGKAAGSCKVYKSGVNDGTSWTEVQPNVSFDADAYQNAVAMGGKLYIFSGGKVYASDNAESWTEVSENQNIMQLIGASSKYLYAYAGEEVAPTIGHESSSFKQLTGILVSKDNGRTWESEDIDNVASFLPTHNLSINTSAIYSTKDAENLLLLGTRPASTDTIATSWTHMVDYATNAPASAWNYMERTNQSGNLPLMDEVLACPADTGFVALGSNSKWYKSKDAGLSWTVDSLVSMPAQFTNGARFGFCRDKNKYYWIINNGYVWKGRFNRDGWRKEQTIFD